MKKLLFILFVTIVFTSKSQITWTGLGGDNLWSTSLNWDLGVPVDGDDVIFDATSISNCSVDVVVNPNSITIDPAYSGIIDLQGNAMNLFNYTQGGGTFISSSDQLGISGTMTKTGGTFTHNGGIVFMYVSAAGTNVISGPFTFNELNINIPTPPSGTLQRNMDFGNQSTASTLTLAGSNKLISYQGNINITSFLNILGSHSTTVPVNNTGIFTLSGAGPITIAGTGAINRNPLGNVVVNTAGTLNMTGQINIRNSWTNTNIGGFTAGSSTVNFCSNVTLTSGSTAATRAYFDHINIPVGGTLNNSGSSQIDMSGTLSHSGTFNPNTGVIFMSSAVAQSIAGSAASTTINALVLTGTGNKSFGHATELLDSVKISSAANLVCTNLTLRSTAALKARLAQISGGGTTSGNLTVQTFAPGGTTDWAVLGVSGISGQTFNNWYGQIPMTIEGSTTGVTSAGGFYFESVQGWIESDAYGYDTTIVVGSAITPGQGYWLYLGTGLGATGNITYNVNGPPVTGNVTVAITAASPTGTNLGFNLVSNPYASPINWESVAASNPAVDNGIYIYNADLGMTTSYVASVSVPGGVTSANKIIPMGQGFYMHTPSNTNLTFAESHKVSNNTAANPLLRSSQANSPGNVIYLRLNSSNDYDETAIRFHPACSMAFDKEFDAYKMFSSPGYAGYPGQWLSRTSISSRLGSDDYSINSIPEMPGQSAVIPILAKTYYSGTHTISPVNLQALDANVCVTLKDKLLNITHDLRSGPYICNINDTTKAVRFELTVCSNAAQPVDVKSQTAQNNSILIAQDKAGANVNLNFAIPTDATISVMNILGEKIIADKKVSAAMTETVKIDLSNINNQLLFVTVTTDNNRVTKKIIR